jgi:hypothetical protein
MLVITRSYRTHGARRQSRWLLHDISTGSRAVHCKFYNAVRNDRSTSGFSGGTSCNASWSTTAKQPKIKPHWWNRSFDSTMREETLSIVEPSNCYFKVWSKKTAIQGPNKTHRKYFTAVIQSSGGIQMGSTELWSTQNPNILTLLTVVFWVVAPCSLVEVYRRFRGAYRLHHHPENSLKT